MLGAHATYPGSLKTIKLHKRQVLIIGVLLLALAGGWWAVGSGALSRWLPSAQPVTAATGQIVIEQAQPTDLTVSQTQSGQTAPAVVNLNTASADVTAAPAAETAAASTVTASTVTVSTAAASTGATEPIAIAGVAGVNGASIWDDTGALLGTLDSGALVTVGGSAGDGTWLSVQTAAGAGWAPASSIIAYGLGRLTSVALPDAVIAAANTSIAAASGPDTPAATTAATTAAVNTDVGTAAATSAASDAAQSTEAALIAQVTGVGTHLNIRSGPGTDYGVIAQTEDGATYLAVGRNAAGDWLLIQTGSATGSTGWAAASFLALSGDLQVLPVVDAAAGA